VVEEDVEKIDLKTLVFQRNSKEEVDSKPIEFSSRE